MAIIVVVIYVIMYVSNDLLTIC